MQGDVELLHSSSCLWQYVDCLQGGVLRVVGSVEKCAAGQRFYLALKV